MYYETLSIRGFICGLICRPVHTHKLSNHRKCFALYNDALLLVFEYYGRFIISLMYLICMEERTLQCTGPTQPEQCPFGRKKFLQTFWLKSQPAKLTLRVLRSINFIIWFHCFTGAAGRRQYLLIILAVDWQNFTRGFAIRQIRTVYLEIIHTSGWHIKHNIRLFDFKK